MSDNIEELMKRYEEDVLSRHPRSIGLYFTKIFYGDKKRTGGPVQNTVTE